jgi:hypothetical protein
MPRLSAAEWIMLAGFTVAACGQLATWITAHVKGRRAAQREAERKATRETAGDFTVAAHGADIERIAGLLSKLDEDQTLADRAFVDFRARMEERYERVEKDQAAVFNILETIRGEIRNLAMGEAPGALQILPANRRGRGARIPA